MKKLVLIAILIGILVSCYYPVGRPTNIPDWSTTTVYSTGDLVMVPGYTLAFESMHDSNINHFPLDDYPLNAPPKPNPWWVGTGIAYR
jgi:hypothetical protein